MAAQYGTAQFATERGTTITKDLYFDDTATNPVRWDAGSGATSTSSTFWNAPENIVLVDVVLAAATGQTKTQIARNDAPTGDIIRNAINLASITFRPQLRIRFSKGDKVTMTQLA